MKLKIGMFEVDIKAKSDFNSKFNKNDTELLLSSLAVALWEASIYDRTQGLENTAIFNEEMAKDIRNAII